MSEKEVFYNAYYGNLTKMSETMIKKQKHILKALGVWKAYKRNTRKNHGLLWRLRTLTLNESFIYRETPEGFDFWRDVQDKMGGMI